MFFVTWIKYAFVARIIRFMVSCHIVAISEGKHVETGGQ